jgi:hypothetical protein
MIENRENVLQRLMKHTKYDETSGCWEWLGSKRNGYGRMIVGSRKDGTRRSVSAHRVSFELEYGDIPSGMVVCHKCDNPCCVNPSHLFVGTRQDNVDDRESKGRNNPPRGAANAKTKLTEEKVMQIRKKRLQGVSFGKLAKEYGVCKKTIQDAVSGKNWFYLPEPPKGVAE